MRTKGNLHLRPLIYFCCRLVKHHERIFDTSIDTFGMNDGILNRMFNFNIFIMQKNARSLYVLLFLLMSITVFAQEITVTGKVVDSDGLEVIGANITLKGSRGTGTVTDINGVYKLKSKNPSRDVLVFSFIGMDSQEVPVRGRDKINVTLRANAVMLDEVVAIGYSGLARKDITGSVVSVDAAALSKVPVSDITQALAGRVSGVMVSKNEGGPGSSISIRVRGGISITQSNEPLYIIDGFPSEDGLSSLDPADIESINILKDASSTAVYGARGANGVVVITTKTGAKGNDQFSISYDTYLGVSRLAKKLDVLSPKEYVFLDYERRNFSDDDINNGNITSFTNLYGNFADIDKNYANRKGVDWQEQMFGGTKTTQNHRLTLAGGNKNLRYNMSYAYFDEEGLMRESGSSKHNVKLKVDHSPNKRLTASGSILFDHSTVYGMGTSGDNYGFNKMGSILSYRPTVGILGDDQLLIDNDDPLYDDDQNAMQNPIISAISEHKKREQRSIQINGSISYELFKGLTFKNVTGARFSTRRGETFYGSMSQNAKRTSINGSLNNNEQGSFSISNTLNYTKAINKHSITAMIGQEYVQRWSRWFSASASNFPNDDIGLNDMSLGAVPGTPGSGFNDDDLLLSFFGSVNYSYADKYLLAATMRADGASKFGPNNKWGYFPAVSVAWRAVQEDFIKNLEVFSDLKVRVGYGLAGNNRIPSYASLPIMNSYNNFYANGEGITTGFASTQIPNKYLKWEANKTLNIGIDMGFFNQRLTISPEFYINRSSNLLLNTKIPTSSGYGTMLQNIGETENKGIDLSISSVNIQNKDFQWTTNFNLSHNVNKVIALNDQNFFYEEARFGWSQNNYIVEVGKSIGRIYGFKTIGLYQVDDFNYDATTKKYTLKDGIAYNKNNAPQPGYWKFENTNDEGTSKGVIDDNDRTVIGNSNPYLYGGMNNTFSYKGFDLSIFLNFSLGGDILNATKLANTLAGRTANNTSLDATNSSNRWVTIGEDGKKINDPETLARLNAHKTVASYVDLQEGDKFMHSWAVEDGSFLRIDNISLGYTFPTKMLKKTKIVKKLRLYLTANNIYTFTNYTGFDPEVSTMGNGITRGVDWGAYPRTRSFVCGGTITF